LAWRSPGDQDAENATDKRAPSRNASRSAEEAYAHHEEGRVKLEKSWSDKRIAKKADAEVDLVHGLRGDLHGRLGAEVVREPLIEK
jgi:hypothetical protein